MKIFIHSNIHILLQIYWKFKYHTIIYCIVIDKTGFLPLNLSWKILDWESQFTSHYLISFLVMIRVNIERSAKIWSIKGSWLEDAWYTPSALATFHDKTSRWAIVGRIEKTIKTATVILGDIHARSDFVPFHTK